MRSADVRFDPAWHLHGLHCLRLENRRVALAILPECGGKIISLIDKRADRELLWRSPRVAPHRAQLHANFDDHWSGGWDEAFPTAGPCRNRYGDELPYLGELWTATASWRVEAHDDAVRVETTVMTPITPARVTRRISLRPDSPTVEIGYRVENTGTMPFDYGLGIHPVQAVGPDHRLDVPATTGLVDEWGGDGLGRTDERYRWPLLGGSDMRRVRGPDAGSFALHYLDGLAAGWVATTDVAERRGFGLVFDPAFFRCVWLWVVYGGFRGYYHAMAEPWTGYPARLDDQVGAGRARVLEPGSVDSTVVHAVLYAGVASVGVLGADGHVASADG